MFSKPTDLDQPRLSAAKVLQIVIKKTLNPDAESVDAHVAQGFKVFQRQRVGIGLKGDFGVRGDGIVFLNKVHQIVDFQYARSAATEIQGLDGFATEIVFPLHDFLLQGFQKPLFPL